MGTLDSLLEEKGRKGALEAGFERPVVEAAATYLADEDAGLGFAYSGWAQCALPHKRLADDAPWGIVSKKVNSWWSQGVDRTSLWTAANPLNSSVCPSEATPG